MTTDAASRRESWTQGRAVKAVLVVFAVIALLCGTVYAFGASSRRSFTIHGSTPTGALRPGVAVPVDLRLTNSHDSALRIGGLAVRIERIDAPQANPSHPCAAGDFGIVQFSGDEDVELPASGTRSLSALGIPATQWPQVTMTNRSVNQDGCKDAKLTLGFTGVASSRGA
jgi:hypothetical protein